MLARSSSRLLPLTSLAALLCAVLLASCSHDRTSTGAAGTSSTTPPEAPTKPTSLAESIQPLRSFFNQARGKNRFVALLSPTCGACLAGARAVRTELLSAADRDRWAIALVWIPMRPTDDEEALRQATRDFAHPRIYQFVDHQRFAGWACARAAFPAFRDPAWDVYLFWPKDAVWTGADPPRPRERLAQYRGPDGAPRIARDLDERRKPVAIGLGRDLGQLLRERVAQVDR